MCWCPTAISGTDSQAVEAAPSPSGATPVGCELVIAWSRGIVQSVATMDCTSIQVTELRCKLVPPCSCTVLPVVQICANFRRKSVQICMCAHKRCDHTWDSTLQPQLSNLMGVRTHPGAAYSMVPRQRSSTLRFVPAALPPLRHHVEPNMPQNPFGF